MEWIEKEPLPAVCQICQEPECDVCDYGMERFCLTDADQELLRRRLQMQRQPWQKQA